MSEVAFEAYGFAFMSVDIKPRHSQTLVAVTYKVDTGANCTTIDYRQLLNLGYDENWIKSGRRLEGTARPTMASGYPVDDCYQVILPEIRIGDCVGYNWPFITSLTAPFKSLLGTDSMRFFNWHFDYERGLCKFDLIPGRRQLIFNSQEQSIHSLDELE